MAYDMLRAAAFEPESPEALVRNFTAILDDSSYQEVMELLDVGGFQRTTRRNLRREFRALYAGLWRLALIRSFPDDYGAIFQHYLDQEAARVKKRREAAANIDHIRTYVDKLSEHGDADFSAVSRHILSLLNFDETQTKAMTLKLALHLRRMYQHFFDNLL